MSEQKEDLGAVDIGDGNKPSSTPVIDSANQAAERMERAAAVLKAENDRLEILRSEKILGGMTDAGQTVSKPEMSPQEYARAILEGKIK